MTSRPIVVLTLLALEGTAFAAPSAEDLYDQGEAAYNKGDYALALAKLNQSYVLSKEPELLFRIGQALRLDGRCEEALAMYRRFIEMVPGSDERALADELVLELEAKCGARPGPAHHVDDPDSGANLKLAGFVTGGTGAALLVTGLLFGRRASALGDEVTQACAVMCDWDDEAAKDRDGKRYATVGKVLDVIGVAAIATGIGLYLYGVRKDETALTIQPQSSGGTVSLGGRW